jgi:hypothetical protein
MIQYRDGRTKAYTTYKTINSGLKASDAVSVIKTINFKTSFVATEVKITVTGGSAKGMAMRFDLMTANLI